MKKIILVLLCLGFLSVVTGCQKPAQKPDAPQQESSGLTTSDRRVIADMLSKQAKQVEGVQNATVVLTEQKENETVTPSPTPGQTQVQGLVAMVGITVKSGADADKVKAEVANKLKAADNRVTHVLVTTDPNLIKKINDVAAGLIDGKPFQTMKDDISAINQQISKENPRP